MILSIDSIQHSTILYTFVSKSNGAKIKREREIERKIRRERVRRRERERERERESER